MNFQVAENTPRLREERESGKRKGLCRYLLCSWGKRNRGGFSKREKVLAETQSVTFLISTEMKKSTKHF